MFVEGYATGSPSDPAAATPSSAPTNSAPGARAIHAALIAAARPSDALDDAFDTHVLACLLAVAIEESARDGSSLCDALGLAAETLSRLLADWFPCFDRVNLALDGAAPQTEMEEDILRDLLKGYGVGGSAAPSTSEDLRSADTTSLRETLADILPTVIARRAMRPDHLWQDLGLFDRGDLNRLLARHFPTLHAGNTANMRWKKYFYRKLCEAEGFALCTAPSCAVCSDFASCFGEEDGESRMAATRRAVDLSAVAASSSQS